MIAAALGWLGTVGTFGAYLLLVNGRVHATSAPYALLNTAGGLLAGCGAVLYGAWPSVASNFIWAALGLYSFLATVWRSRAAGELRVLPATTEQGELELAS